MPFVRGIPPIMVSRVFDVILVRYMYSTGNETKSSLLQSQCQNINLTFLRGIPPKMLSLLSVFWLHCRALHVLNGEQDELIVAAVRVSNHVDAACYTCRPNIYARLDPKDMLILSRLVQISPGVNHNAVNSSLCTLSCTPLQSLQWGEQ